MDSKRTLKFLAWATRWTVVPLTKTGNPERGAGWSVKEMMSLWIFKVEGSVRHSSGDVQEVVDPRTWNSGECSEIEIQYL